MTDAFDLGLRASDYRRGFPSVSFALSIPVGPKSLKAGVTLAYEGQYPLAFQSRAVWPAGDDYEAVVRAAMLDVLMKDGVPVIGGVFTLVSIEWDAVHSCEIAFSLAAKEATRSLLSLVTRHDEKE
jgi:hypothetical protein